MEINQLELSVLDLDLPTQALNTLRRNGIDTIGQLVAMDWRDVYDLRQMGYKSIRLIIEALGERGLKMDGWYDSYKEHPWYIRAA
jgi:DNA-directed RNA polymerase subunit alpha